MPTAASMTATKKAMVRLVRAPAQMRAHKSCPMELEPQRKPCCPGAMLRYWMPVAGSTAQRLGSACPGSSGCTKANTTTAASAASSATASLFLKKARKVLPQ